MRQGELQMMGRTHSKQPTQLVAHLAHLHCLQLFIDIQKRTLHFKAIANLKGGNQIFRFLLKE